jgi:hypothetical protein
MLTKLESFKGILLILKFFGLVDSESDKKWKKTLQFASFLIFFMLCFVLFILKLVLDKEVALFILGLTIISSQVILLLKIVNFYLKAKCILKVMKNLSDVWKPSEIRMSLLKSLKKTTVYFKTSTAFSLIVILSTVSSPIITGYFHLPLFIPQFIVDYKLFLPVHYILEVGMSMCCTILLLILDSMPLCCLMDDS